MKATGVKAGMPDLCLPIPMQRVGRTTISGSTYRVIGYAGLFIELKRPDSAGKAAGKLSSKQVELHGRLRAEGSAVCVAYGWQAAVVALWVYLSGFPIEDFYDARQQPPPW
jgi:hypothetical protein